MENTETGENAENENTREPENREYYYTEQQRTSILRFTQLSLMPPPPNPPGSAPVYMHQRRRVDMPSVHTHS